MSHDTDPGESVTMSGADLAQLVDERNQLRDERDRLLALVNTPELHDFAKAVVLEAAHQRERWASDSDAGKTPADWFWLVGHLGTRALEHHKEAERVSTLASFNQDHWVWEREIEHHREKAVHHTITAAAALANWHAAVLGLHTAMRPGIDAAAHGVAA